MCHLLGTLLAVFYKLPLSIPSSFGDSPSTARSRSLHSQHGHNVNSYLFCNKWKMCAFFIRNTLEKAIGSSENSAEHRFGMAEADVKWNRRRLRWRVSRVRFTTAFFTRWLSCYLSLVSSILLTRSQRRFAVPLAFVQSHLTNDDSCLSMWINLTFHVWFVLTTHGTDYNRNLTCNLNAHIRSFAARARAQQNNCDFHSFAGDCIWMGIVTRLFECRFLEYARK